METVFLPAKNLCLKKKKKSLPSLILFSLGMKRKNWNGLKLPAGKWAIDLTDTNISLCTFQRTFVYVIMSYWNKPDEEKNACWKKVSTYNSIN